MVLGHHRVTIPGHRGLSAAARRGRGHGAGGGGSAAAAAPAAPDALPAGAGLGRALAKGGAGRRCLVAKVGEIFVGLSFG